MLVSPLEVREAEVEPGERAGEADAVEIKIPTRIIEPFREFFQRTDGCRLFALDAFRALLRSGPTAFKQYRHTTFDESVCQPGDGERVEAGATSRGEQGGLGMKHFQSTENAFAADEYRPVVGHQRRHL